MATYLGDCRSCGREDVEVYYEDSKCIICKRLDNIEKQMIELTSKIKGA